VELRPFIEIIPFPYIVHSGWRNPIIIIIIIIIITIILRSISGLFQAVFWTVPRARPVGVWIAAKAINVPAPSTPSGPGAHLVPSLHWTPAFFREVIACRVVRLAAHSHLVPRLRMSGSTPQLQPYTFTLQTEIGLCVTTDRQTDRHCCSVKLYQKLV
jgi:hypothetical protein